MANPDVIRTKLLNIKAIQYSEEMNAQRHIFFCGAKRIVLNESEFNTFSNDDLIKHVKNEFGL